MFGGSLSFSRRRGDFSGDSPRFDVAMLGSSEQTLTVVPTAP